MNFAAATFVLLVGVLTSCERSHRSLSGLQPSEQIQALVLDHIAADFIGHPSSGPDDFRLFLSVTLPYAEAPQAVLDYVASSFRSARPFSAIGSYDGTGVTERGTGSRGAILWVQPFSISGDGPITLKAGYFIGDRRAEGFEYQVQRVKGRWTILNRKNQWIT